MAARLTKPSPLLAFAAAAFGIAIFSCMDAVMKNLVLVMGAYSTLLWRNWLQGLISGLIYFARRRTFPTRSSMVLHAIRGGISTVMAVTFFWGLARIPMAQAVALTFIAPLLSVFLAAAMLGERISWTSILASFTALAGIGIILYGQWQSHLGPLAFRGALAVLASALCYAFNIILMRKQALVAGPIEVAFSQSLIVAVLLSLGAPIFAHLPDLGRLPLIFLAAILAVSSLLVLAWAYARGEANYLSPTEYTAFVWAAFFGWLLFDEHVPPATLIGAGLIISGCLLVARKPPMAGEEVINRSTLP